MCRYSKQYCFACFADKRCTTYVHCTVGRLRYAWFTSMMLIVGCSCLLLYDSIYLLKMAFDDLQWCMILGSFYAMLGFIAIIHCVNTGYSFWDHLRNFLHKFTWIVLSVHKLNKLGKFWAIAENHVKLWLTWKKLATIS